MKKLIVLFVLVAFAGFACAELLSTPTANADFEAGMSGWDSWGSGSGSGSSGYKWASHWAYIDTTGGANGSQNFLVATTASQAGYSEWWGYGYDVTWRGSSAEMMDFGANNGTGQVTIGAWMKAVSGTPSAAMTFEWVDWSGGDGGGGGGGTIPRAELSFAVTTDWAYYSATLAVPSNVNGGAYGMRPVWGVNNPGTAIGIDDVSAVWIPEPMSIALLGLGGLFLRRRKVS
jgi:hypothetical protein